MIINKDVIMLMIAGEKM